MPPFTRQTVVRTGLLREQLARIATTGVAFSHEEWRVGTSGVAAPVLRDGTAIAALALVGPPDEAALRRFAGTVRRAATTLAEALAPAGAGVGVAA
jgi:IclR family acetate operon transcriptional repressor